VKQRTSPRAAPPKTPARPFPRHTTVSKARPPRTKSRPRPAPRAATPRPPARVAPRSPAPRRQVGRIIDDEEASLVDVIDTLLSKGAMVNADLVLALADVDLVYIRLSALLCAADRVLRHKP
jgi:hypothetical protein